MALREREGRIATPKPNWRTPVSGEYWFKTTVVTHYSGIEQRSALRQTPRFAITYRSLLQLPEMRQHLADLADGSPEPWIVPVPWFSARLAAAAAPGDTAIQIDSSPFWVTPGASLVLESATVEEAVLVLAVSGTTVTISTGLVNGFQISDKVRLAVSGRERVKTRFSMKANEVWEGQVRYDADPGLDPHPAKDYSGLLFEDREVFDFRPNYRNDGKARLMELRQVLDYGSGRIDVSNPQDFNTEEYTLTFTGMTRDSSDDLISFFVRQKGKRGSFWYPSGRRDMSARVPIAAGGSAYEVAGNDFYYSYFGNPSRVAVRARFQPGGYQINRITAIDIAGQNTLLSFQDPWTQAIDPSTHLEWCFLSRFASDKLRVRWHTTDVAEMSMAVQSIRG